MNWLIHHAKRVLRITGGAVLLIVGLILMFPGVPGPGFPLVLLGLGILAVDFVWAHRLKTHLKNRTDKVVEKVRGRPRSGAVASPRRGSRAGS
jgi:uncharacterized protein (TIGR02611 family)